MRRDVGISIAIGLVGRPALERAGMLKTSSERRGIMQVAYLAYWWVVALGVTLLPTYKDQPLFVFPAVLALSVAWLVTIPSYSQAIVTTDFSLLKPPKGTWGRLIEALQKQRVDVPDVLRTDQSKAAMDAIVPTAVPAVLPVVLLDWFRWLSLRAIYVALIGMFGLLAGPSLAGVHWWHGWTPVSFLYALSAPWVGILLVALIIPTFLQGLIAGLRADRDLAAVMNPADGTAPIADENAEKRSRRKATHARG